MEIYLRQKAIDQKNISLSPNIHTEEISIFLPCLSSIRVTKITRHEEILKCIFEPRYSPSGTVLVLGCHYNCDVLQIFS